MAKEKSKSTATPKKPGRKPATKPKSSPAKAATAKSARASKAAPAAKHRPKKREVPVTPPFQMKVALLNDRRFGRMLSAGLSEASKMLRAQIETSLQIDNKAEERERRKQDRLRKRIAKGMEKALVVFGTKILDPQQLAFSEVEVDMEQSLVKSTEIEIGLPVNMQRRFHDLYKELLAALDGENAAYDDFSKPKNEISGAFGGGLDDSHFLAGTVNLKLNRKSPGESTVEYSMQLFAKKGKRMGMNVQVSLVHSLAPGKFSATGTVGIPLK